MFQSASRPREYAEYVWYTTPSSIANALVPGQVTQNMRSIWQLDQVQVYDGGADGTATTADNTLFMDEGVFAP